MIETFIYGICEVLCAMLLAFSLTPLVRVLAIRIKAIDVPRDGRRMHCKPIPRIGGLSIFLSFLCTSLAFHTVDRDLAVILLGGGILVLLGIFDDIYNLNAFFKLAVQVLVALFAAWQGIRINFIGLGGAFVTFAGWLSVLITVLWIVGLTNAVNFIDGLDGLACGVSTIGSISLLCVFLLTDRSYTHCMFTAILAGACLGFLPFNVNPARIFMGDTGALFLGYTLSVLSITSTSKVSTVVAFFIPLAIFGLPIADTAIAVIRRLLHGQSPFKADRGHLHHKLMDMGFGQKQSVRILYAVCALLGIASVMLTNESWVGGAIMLIVAILIFFITFLILRDPKWRSHMGIYNEDEGAKPPVESFEDIGVFLPVDIEDTLPQNSTEESNCEKRKQK